MDGGAVALVTVGAAAVVLVGVGCLVRSKLMGALASRATGEQRRKLVPPGASRALAETVCPIPVDDSQLEITHGFYRLRDTTLQNEHGKQLFYSLVMPKKLKKN